MCFPCKYCSHLLFPNHDEKLYEDDARTMLHICPVLKSRARQNPDHKLLTYTVTRVSKLESRISDLEIKISELMEKIQCGAVVHG